MGHLKEKYTKEYFLGSVDKESGKAYGVAGFNSFKSGQIDSRFTSLFKGLDLKNKTVLDIGCGRGEIVGYCAKKGCREVVGIDFSKDALDIASDFTRAYSNIKLLQMEARDIEYKGMFDIVFLLDIIEHIPDEEMQRVYSKVYTALGDGGMLILNTPLFNSQADTDDSDAIASTSGMHCNKQTKEKLCSDLKKHGFRRYDVYVWGKSRRFSVPIFLYVVRQKLSGFLSRVRLVHRITHPKKELKKLFSLVAGKR